MPSNGAKPYRLNSFFAGIGGFDLALERHGFAPSFYCEKDPFCRSVLRTHWPDIPNAGDIRQLAADDVPDAPLWTAGFPCQDLSLAKVPHGRTGFRGSNSSLFFKFHELLSGHKPQVVLLENVAGLLNSHGGADFTRLLEVLMDLGYAVAWRVLNARYFGVPQSRPRVFICGWLNDPRRAVGSLFETTMAPLQKQERLGFITPSQCEITGAIVPHISYCISATSGRHTGLDWARSYVAYRDSVRRLTPLECERLQGFPDGWTRVTDDGVTPIYENDTERYSAIGNAVAIPVAEWVAMRIRAQFGRSQPVAGQAGIATSRSRPDAVLAGLAREFSVPEARIHGFEEGPNLRWQRAGCAFNWKVVHAQASTAPIHPIESRFVDLLENGHVNQRYFLSANAARGILRRVERRKRNLFEPLAKALRLLADGTSLSGDRCDPAPPARRRVTQ